MRFTLAQIAQIINGRVEGNPETIINDLAEIQHAQEGDLTFLANPKYAKFVSATNASAILVAKDFSDKFKNIIRVDDPYFAFSQLIPKFRPPIAKPEPGTDPSAKIADSASVGKDCYIGPNLIIEDNSIIGDNVILLGNSYIGQNSIIGDNSIIFPNVSIYHRCKIENNARLHSGTVIGSDGYGFVRTETGISKIPQEGGVEIGDDVEIGANCAIDRGTLGNTTIGKGTKLDNFIQIAHNVKLGEYCFMAAMSGIAGSTKVGNYVTIAAQVGVAGHLTIGDGVIIAAQSGVTKDTASNVILFGSPAQEQHKARREIAHIRSIPDLKERVHKLETELKSLQNQRK